MSTAQRLNFNRALFDRADEILEVVWKLVEPLTARALTKTAWKGRFRAHARDLATLGRTNEEITAAWEAACERTGMPIWSLRIIQDQLARGVAAAKPDEGNDFALYAGDE